MYRNQHADIAVKVMSVFYKFILTYIDIYPHRVYYKCVKTVKGEIV